jgi:hypothetical protein
MTPEEIRRQKLVEGLQQDLNPSVDFDSPGSTIEPVRSLQNNQDIEVDPGTEISRDPSGYDDMRFYNAYKANDLGKEAEITRNMRVDDIVQEQRAEIKRIIDETRAANPHLTDRDVIRLVTPYSGNIRSPKIRTVTEPFDVNGVSSVGAYNPSTDELRYMQGQSDILAHEGKHKSEGPVSSVKVPTSQESNSYGMGNAVRAWDKHFKEKGLGERNMLWDLSHR